MYSKDKLLEKLSSKKASVRYETCEWIRVSQESSPMIIKALEKATQDEDKDVAERAITALKADVHHQMAIKMGMIEPEKTEENEYIQNLQPEKMNTENKEAEVKIRRIWGWILTIAGGLFTLWGLFGVYMVVFHYSRIWHFGFIAFSIDYGILGLFFTVPLLILGLWLLYRKETGKSRVIWGCVLAIFGGLYTLWGLFCLHMANISNSIDGFVEALFTLAAIPGFICGIPLLFLGIWSIRKGTEK
jgi:hypothetical protein